MVRQFFRNLEAAAENESASLNSQQLPRTLISYSSCSSDPSLVNPEMLQCRSVFPYPCFRDLQVKSSQVYVRDSSMVPPIALLLFAGKTISVIEEGKRVQ